MVGIIRTAVAASFMVTSGSMEQTIQVGDCMLVNKFAYGIHAPFADNVIVPVGSPRRDDIIVFRASTEPDLPQPEQDYARIFPSRLQLLPIFWNKVQHRLRWYSPRTLIKRCVAVAGDTVEVRNKQLYVNGRAADDEHVTHGSPYLVPGHQRSADEQLRWERGDFANDYSVRDNFGPVVVPPGHVMAMGDNRDNSWDSRFWGPLDVRYIKGKPLILYFSYDFPPEAYTEGPESELKNPNIFEILLRPWGIRPGRIGHLLT
jgi:signal peptidase I